MTRKITLPVEAAREFAKSITDDIFMEGFMEGLKQAEENGWDALTVEAIPGPDDTFDVVISEPSGVIVGWFIPEWEAARLALPGGEPAADLHVTLGYFGEAADMSADDQRKLLGVTAEVAARHPFLSGELRGIGRFTNGQPTDAFWVGVDIPRLAELRDDLISSLEGAGISTTGFGAGKAFIPHITVAYLPAEAPTPPVTVAGVPTDVTELTVAIGGARHRLPLVAPLYADGEVAVDQSYSAYIPDIVTKSRETIEEQRFTLAPWYIPNKLDAHGDWTDPQEIQKALWGYVKTDDRRIRLQHNTDIVAGEWVEAMTWPFEVEVPLTKADGTVTKHKYPAGTTFMGTQWEPWAWELVKSGDLRGFSIGGSGDMVLADLPGADA